MYFANIGFFINLLIASLWVIRTYNSLTKHDNREVTSLVLLALTKHDEVDVILLLVIDVYNVFLHFNIMQHLFHSCYICSLYLRHGSKCVPLALSYGVQISYLYDSLVYLTTFSIFTNLISVLLKYYYTRISNIFYTTQKM